MARSSEARLEEGEGRDDLSPADTMGDEDAAMDALRERQAREAERVAEALVFASAEPVTTKDIAARLPKGCDVDAVMNRLCAFYADRGVNLLRIGDAWAFRTSADLSFLIHREEVEQKKLSRAALEVLAIIAYHQPVTRAEIEEIRGVATSKGTIDVLMETNWIRMRGRRRTPGRPVTYGTTAAFLDHFGLEELRDLPGIEELKGAGLLSSRLPANFNVPLPPSDDDLFDDEDPLDAKDLEELGLLPPAGD